MKKLICPQCGSLKHTVLCLTSNPPRFEYECHNCKWSLRYFNRDNSYLPITQMELDFEFRRNSYI